MGCQEAARHVHGDRPRVGAEAANAAVGRHEIKSGLYGQQVVDADALAEMGEVGATAHAGMLAGIDELPGGGVGEGTGPTAETIARFQQRDLKAARSQGLGRRQPGQSAADNDDSASHSAFPIPHSAFPQAHPQRTGQARSKRASFRHRLSRTRLLNTS